MSVQKYLKLNSGYSIPTLGLGTWLLSRSEAPELVFQALKKGYRHIDTAILYDNEFEVSEGIAKWLKDDPINNKREDIFYTSKLWDFRSYEEAKQEIERALEAVEDNLGYIDLLLLHSPNVGPNGRRNAWKALQEVVATGKVKSIGISSWGIHHIEGLLEWDGLKIKPAVNQIELSPWLMRQEIVEHYKKLGIVLEAYSPLAHGGRLNDPIVKAIAEKHGKTPAQILLRWSLQQGFVPLPKTSNIERLDNNLDVYDFELNDSEIENLNHPKSHDNTDWECTTNP
ncbi:hypothetical protein WICMUC_002990 [Wickerhamomyces mucosus]|uniref:NADP-dependent oxidoreductase domain-containing protein n=1 Tax=Wickerhamomyces mucosus TaxID=1378264 RepID=A0A9P8PNM5_9ASCO|nr:hypothetical protein WICMUC_002990 [Wickerhamomyces mucosus]